MFFIKGTNKSDEPRMNEKIRAREIRVIGDDGEQFGILSVNEALALATEKNLDLVEISPNATPPVCKIMDYGKYIFKQQKQQAQNKSNTKKTELKTMKITYKIGDHDLDVRRKQAEKWAKEGNPMKVFLQLRGRENQYEDIAIEKIEEFIQSVEAFYKKDDKSKLQKQ